MTDKQVFRNILQLKHRGNSPFVPFVCGLAARTASISPQQMIVDPGLYTSALEGFHALLGVNIMVVNYDACMESEALGAEVDWSGENNSPVVIGQEKSSGIGPDEYLHQTRISALIETVHRLSVSAGQEKAVACALLGPCSFIHMLQSVFAGCGSMDTDALIKQYGPYVSKLVRILCEQKIDALFFREDVLGEQFMPLLSRHQASFNAFYRTLFNIVQAFNAFALIVTDHLAVESFTEVHAALKPNGIVLLGHTAAQTDLNALYEMAGALKMAVGFPLPTGGASQQALSASVEALEACRPRNGLNPFFYCSDGEIPRDMDLSILLGLMERLNNAGD